jgi:hypothetical protein
VGRSDRTSTNDPPTPLIEDPSEAIAQVRAVRQHRDHLHCKFPGHGVQTRFIPFAGSAACAIDREESVNFFRPDVVTDRKEVAPVDCSEGGMMKQ